ncbi:MAG: M55 family metallopeptidase [Gemmatimonadota bacterium]
MPRFGFLAVLLCAPCSLLAAQATPYTPPHLPPPHGFRVFIVPDMEGMGSAVDIHEVIAGNEGEQYKTLTSPDYWDHFRSLLTREVNATIAGARLAGARSFVVNEGHGGNMFANILPWDLDTGAILVRGFPKPLVMVTGIDSTVGTLMFTGAHAGPGHPGILAHNFAFDTFTVNGKSLNEVGINALIASEYGVAVSLVSGDDAEIAETRTILGSGFIGIVTKYAVGRMAAITFSPTQVRRWLRDSATVAVRRAMRGDFKPFRLDKPYHVAFALRRSYPEVVVARVDSLNWTGLEKTGERSYRLTTDDARQMGYLLDAIERVVLR